MDTSTTKELQLLIKPVATQDVLIKAKCESIFSEKIHTMLELRMNFQSKSCWKNAALYYECLRSVYYGYSTMSNSNRRKHITVDSGHSFKWKLEKGKVIGYPDIGYEYTCCLVSMLMHIIQQIFKAINLDGLGPMIELGSQMAVELHSLIQTTIKHRDVYLPIHIKMSTLSSIIGIFASFKQTASFFNSVELILLPDEYEDNALTALMGKHLNDLISIYLGMAQIRTLAYRYITTVEDAYKGITTPVKQFFEKSKNEAKLLLTFCSMFNGLIEPPDPKGKLQELAKNLKKLSDSNLAIYSDISTLHTFTLQRIAQLGDIEKSIGKTFLIQNALAAPCKGLGDYVEKTAIKPTFCL